MAQHPLTGENKYFASNASATTFVERLLHVAFTRWHIERCFQDEKGLLGLDHVACRRYRAIQRHLIITTIGHLFLARTRLKLMDKEHANGEENPTLQQLRQAAHASIQATHQTTRTSIQAKNLSRSTRRKQLQYAPDQIRITQNQNAKSHHKKRIQQHHTLDINPKNNHQRIPQNP